jgi:hypothetical protein
MSRVIAAALAVAAVVGGLSQSGLAQAVLIGGRVVSAETGEPLVHARVVVFNDATPLPAIFSDGQGRFSSGPLPPGRYRLTATKAGFAATSVARLGDAHDEGVVVRMPRSSAIGGRIIDRFGEPAAGVQIQLAVPGLDRTKFGVMVKSTRTDDLGEYRFGGLAEGAYIVGSVNALTVQPDGNGRFLEGTSVYYPGVTTLADAQRIVLRPGDETLGIDFSGDLGPTVNSAPALPGNVTLTANGQPIRPVPVVGTGAIRGRVTRADGFPVAHASVSTQVVMTAATLGRQISISGAKSTQTEDDGTYELSELPAGEYRVVVARPGYNTGRYGQREDTDPGIPIDVADAQTRMRIDVVLQRNSIVAGRVLDEYGDPVENVAVTLSQIKFLGGRKRLVTVSAMSGRTTDDLGRYRVYSVPPGDYVVSASVGQVVAFQPSTGVSGYALTYFPSTTNPREAQTVSVPRALDVTGIDFVLVPIQTATVSGRKLAADGQPFGGSLTITPSQRSGALVTEPAGARIYDDGRFEFPNVAPGDYVIQGDQGKSGQDREGPFASAFVTVDGTNVSDVVLQSAPGSTISGRVIFEGDGPTVQSLQIMTSRADFDRTPNSTAQADVRPDLRFAMTGIRGPRRITVGRLPAGWMLKSVIANGVDVTDVALPFGSPDQSLTDVQVVVTSQVTELSGTVADGRGDLATSYTLLVFPVDRDRWYPGSRFFRRAGSGSGGNFSVRGLPPADYFVAPMSGWSVLKDGNDGWQDPDFLESIALRASRATLTEGGRVSLTTKLIMP